MCSAQTALTKTMTFPQSITLKCLFNRRIHEFSKISITYERKQRFVDLQHVVFLGMAAAAGRKSTKKVVELCEFIDFRSVHLIVIGQLYCSRFILLIQIKLTETFLQFSSALEINFHSKTEGRRKTKDFN